MPADKLVDSAKLDAALTYTAGRIRAKGGTSADIPFDLATEKGFGDAVDALPSGGVAPSGTVNITTNGDHNVSQYAQAHVAVPASEVTSGNKALASSASDQTNIDVTEYRTVSISKIAAGTAGTPSASKGAVSNHQVSVTPSVTNTTGYITGGTKTGTAVTVKAEELVSGTLSVTSNGTKDVKNYASVNVNVPGGGIPEPTSIIAGDTPVIFSSVNGVQIAGTAVVDTGIYVDITKAGTYRFKCSLYRSATGESNNWIQLYKNGVAVEGAVATFETNYFGRISYDLQCAAGDRISIHGRTGGNSYRMGISGLAACIDWDNTF